MSLEHEGGYVPPQEEQKIEAEQSEAQKFAQEFLQQKNQETDQRENTIYTPNHEKIDLSSVTGPNDLSPEQKTAIESTLGTPEFTNLKATAEITEKLLDTQIIDTEKAKGVVWDMLKKSNERFIPQELLDKIAKQDRSFARSISEQANVTVRELNGMIRRPDLNEGKLVYAVKALKYRGMSQELSTSILQEKRELVEIKNKALRDIFEPSKERDPYSQQVEQMKLLTFRNGRDVFESGVIPQEKIPVMVKDTIDFLRNNTQFIRQNLRDLQEMMIDLSRMGKLDEEKAKELLAETYELTKQPQH
ncbi:MAG: hypothetical protein Q8Q95_00795 [bacterium]|nr:hypothetical protein [bacterium]